MWSSAARVAAHRRQFGEIVDRRLSWSGEISGSAERLNVGYAMRAKCNTKLPCSRPAQRPLRSHRQTNPAHSAKRAATMFTIEINNQQDRLTIDTDRLTRAVEMILAQE